MRGGSAAVLVAALAAGCGSDGGERSPAARDRTAASANDPRVTAVLECLRGRAGRDDGRAYALDANAISLNTNENGVEIYFDETEARAAERKQQIETVGAGVVYVQGTVVESWVAPPTSRERTVVTACVAKDPGPDEDGY